MKKVLSIAAAAGILAAGTAAYAGTIVNSKHDLRGFSGTETSTQICIYCHAPHQANFSLPLWNRSNPSAALFTLYSGVGMQNVSFKTGFTSDSTSLFCMSCHDGQIAMNAIHNAGTIDGTTASGAVWTAPAGTFSGGQISGPANLTRDLSKTHPINFPVSTVDGQSDLNVSNTGAKMGPVASISGLTSTVTFPLFKSTATGAQSSTRNSEFRSLECGSCHAVHDSAYTPFLRDTMDKSQLCLGCHNK